jgi:hypothetical protein
MEHVQEAPKPKRFAPIFKPRKARLPNGLVLESSWYEHPVFNARGRLRSSDDAVKQVQRQGREVN